jgi:two-component system, NtrC family, response regulator AtoC
MATAHIAIVDDDPLFVEYLATFLKSRGYDTSIYPSGAALMKALPSASVDAVLLDVLMPNMNGLETLREIHTAKPGMPVIMVSGQQVPATIVDAVRLGAIDYVVKSDESEGLNEAALEAAICRAIERVALKSEVERLSSQLAEAPDGAQLCWGPGSAMRDVLTMVDRVANSDVSVLLTGESGVGKEVIARELHRRSNRRGRPFVKVNCAALPADLLESELFGHERGAFTGAQVTRIGKFEFADQGTILLDEIGEMPVVLQAKMLHVVQDREFTKVGSNRPVAVDVRVIAATNRDLETMIRAGQFREDLYYRLQVIEIRVPPLRDRREEIPSLTEFFLRRFAEQYGRPVLRPSQAVRQALSAAAWPGNIRELENTIKRFVILRDEGMLLAELHRDRSPEPAPAPAPAPHGGVPIAEMTPLAAVPAPPAAVAHAYNGAATEPAESEPGIRTGKLPELARAAAMTAEREAIQQALDRFRWNRRKAALLLGVSYKTLLNKMKECGITAPAGLDSDSL